MLLRQVLQASVLHRAMQVCVAKLLTLSDLFLGRCLSTLLQLRYVCNKLIFAPIVSGRPVPHSDCVRGAYSFGSDCVGLCTFVLCTLRFELCALRQSSEIQLLRDLTLHNRI